jgi:diguanylate cyclase (GGDEF)-like protein
MVCAGREKSLVHLLLDPLAPLMRVISLLPKGRSLPEHVWLRRHRGLMLLLWLHIVGLTALGIFRGYGVQHVMIEVDAILVFFGIIGTSPRASRRLRSMMVAMGLLTSSALLVHLTGGLIESHFHFFVIVPLLTLYGDWSVFLLAIGYVAVHHGVFAQLDPTAVFNHPEAWRQPWKWALIHAVYVLGASATALVAWRATEERALRDSLTQLPNTESFLEQAHRARARAKRRREHLGILYLDLDGFKRVNDTLGHGAVDQLLMSVGDRLRMVLRDSDVAARLGGDEFALLLEDVASIAAGETVAARVIQTLNEPFTIKGRPVTISASVGISISDSDGAKHPEELLKEADDAMYGAKGSGKGRYKTSSLAPLAVT